MNENCRHIGMFDSGMGGLTVLKALQERLPFEKVIYLGDTARLPYGGKSAETVQRYSIENAIFLMEQNIKVLVVACNTAASVSLEKLRKIFNIPVVGVIEPGAKKAAQVTKSGKIAVLATQGTILSKAYEHHILKLLPHAEVISIPCPLLVPLIEEGMQRHIATKIILKEYLAILKNKPVDTILLGCTHYPSLIELIYEEVLDGVKIVDSASTCAEEVADILTKKSLYNPAKEAISHKFYVSDSPEKFKRLGEQFLGTPLKEVLLQHLSQE